MAIKVSPYHSTDPTDPLPTAELPATGGSSTAIALLGCVFIATGLCLACVVRDAQVRNSRR